MRRLTVCQYTAGAGKNKLQFQQHTAFVNTQLDNGSDWLIVTSPVALTRSSIFSIEKSLFYATFYFVKARRNSEVYEVASFKGLESGNSHATLTTFILSIKMLFSLTELFCHYH